MVRVQKRGFQQINKRFRTDAMQSSKLVHNTISSELVSGLMYTPTTQSIWEDLANSYI